MNRNLFAIGFSTLAFCFVSTTVSAAELKVGGGAAPMENVFKKIQAPFEKASGIKLVLDTNGPDEAFIGLEAGKLDVATAGLSYADWLDLMTKKGHPIAKPGDYTNRVVGRDKIQFIANKSAAAVKSLTKDQLKDIFTGKIANWKEVGGPDQAITLVYGTKIPGTNKMWTEKVLDNQEWSKKNYKEATDADAVKKLIAATPGAAGIGPLASEDSGIFAPTTPEVGRPITMVTKGKPSKEVQTLIDFIAKDGQNYISK